jgi:anti-anti-sigma regulatory factor
MVLKIDRSTDGKCVRLQLSGRIQSEHVEQLRAEMAGAEVVLDLEDVKLVDREAVRFLGDCEANGVKLTHCSRYIRDWIARERSAKDIQ